MLFLPDRHTAIAEGNGYALPKLFSLTNAATFKLIRHECNVRITTQLT
jgi:hypothetical protein